MLSKTSSSISDSDEPEIKSRKFLWWRKDHIRPQRWWLNNDPLASAVYSGLSLNFPRAEAFFIESVRVYRGEVSPKLANEIQAFTKQELMHTHEHISLNRRIVAAGYDISGIESRADEVLRRTREMPAVYKLAATMILEHITAIESKQILTDERHMAGAEPDIAALWCWHSVEEIEHKGVAHDVWLHATRRWSAWRRWKVKSAMTLIVTAGFCKQRWIDTLDLLRQDEISGFRVWINLLWFLLGKPGMVRKLLIPWVQFFLPGFHPWNHDDRALIKLTDSKYQDAIRREVGRLETIQNSEI